MRWADLLLEVVAPSRCAACDEHVRTAVAFCAGCASSLEPAPANAPVLAAFAYGGALARAIARFKYEDRPDLGRPLAACFARLLEPVRAFAPDVIVPVPLHPARLAERGYNQAALLARPLAAAAGAPFGPCALARVRPTPRQALLDAASRRANLDRAFTCADVRKVAGRRVLVVDDVRTTGATLDACAVALRAAGASAIACAVVAVAVANGHDWSPR